MTIKIGGKEIIATGQRSSRLSMLLWGSSGCGKTTLAATAPGRKALVNFDPDGPDSIADYDDVGVFDLSDMGTGMVEQFKHKSSPLGLRALCEAGEHDTLIIDSLTNATHICLQHGISITKGATIERPSPGAYMVRNALTVQLVKNVLRLTGEFGMNVIFIAHEAAPTTNDDGIVLYISLMLGGQLPEQASLDFSEVWNMQEADGKRRICIRPVRQRKPMKTRIFKTDGNAEFVWTYNSTTKKGPTLDDWYTGWVDGGKKKISLPK